MKLSVFFVAVAGLLLLGFRSVFGGEEKSSPIAEFLPYTENIPGSDQHIDMVPIKGTEFLMGSPDGEADRNKDEGPQTKVKIDPFWMSTCEITWDQFQLFFNEKMAQFKNKTIEVDGKQIKVDAVSSPTPEYIDMSFGMGREGGFPVTNITNFTAVMFTKWLFAKTGHFYRLPTEAEWELAARGGTESAYYFGGSADNLADYAWFKDNSESGYSKVGEKKPNAFGLYDMLGNVAEWTMDEYIPDYFAKLKGGNAVDPWIKPTGRYPRAVRGGSWMDEAKDLRVARRRGSSPEWIDLDPQIPKSRWWLTSAPFVGIRVVRPQKAPSQEEMEEYWRRAEEGY